MYIYINVCLIYMNVHYMYIFTYDDFFPSISLTRLTPALKGLTARIVHGPRAARWSCRKPFLRKMVFWKGRWFFGFWCFFWVCQKEKW